MCACVPPRNQAALPGVAHRELLPQDKRLGLSCGVGLAREIGRANLLELSGCHSEVDPLVAKGVAERAAEGGDVHKAVVAPVVRVHQDAHVQATRADDGGHAVPNGLALSHADRVEGADVAGHGGLRIHQPLNRGRRLVRPLLQPVVPVPAAVHARSRFGAEDVTAIAVGKVCGRGREESEVRSARGLGEMARPWASGARNGSSAASHRQSRASFSFFGTQLRGVRDFAGAGIGRAPAPREAGQIHCGSCLKAHRWCRRDPSVLLARGAGKRSKLVATLEAKNESAPRSILARRQSLFFA